MDVKSLLSLGIDRLDIPEARFESELILMSVLKKDRTFLFSNYNKTLQSKVVDSFKKHIEERKNGKPLYYILKEKPFFNVSIFVDENVLIPRYESEILVEKVIEFSKGFKKTSILDMCTGSGVIAVSICVNTVNTEIHAVDISASAIRIAMKNVKKYSLEDRISCYQSDLFSNVQRKFDVIVANPPYIPSDYLKECSSDVLKEPMIALDGGYDGLVFIRKLIEQSLNHLNKNGLLLFEISGDGQNRPVMDLLLKKGFSEIFTLKDLAGLSRVCGGLL